MELSAIYKPVQSSLDSVEDVILSTLRDADSQLADNIGSFIARSSGKRLRPAMLLLSAGACTSITPADQRLVNVAAAMELMHVASLIHDDVIDAAPTRHNMPTINSKWADNISIVFGDYVYSKAMSLVAVDDNSAIFGCLSQAVTSMCQGQLAQVAERNNFELSYDSYISIVKNKTASLFAVCCKVGAVLTDADSKVVDALESFGESFGIAYQIMDDYCDVVEHKSNLGKDPGQDILLGEITLPIMNLLACSDGDKKNELVSLLKAGAGDAMETVRQTFVDSKASAITRQALDKHIANARAALNVLPETDFKTSLNSLVNIIQTKVSAAQTAR